MKNSMEVTQKIKNRKTTWPSNSTSGYLLKENENTTSKRYMHPYVYCSIICSNQDIETTEVSFGRCMNKEDMVYTMEYYSAMKNEWNLAIWDNIDGPGSMQNEMSEKDKCLMVSLICKIKKKKKPD